MWVFVFNSLQKEKKELSTSPSSLPVNAELVPLCLLAPSPNSPALLCDPGAGIGKHHPQALGV